MPIKNVMQCNQVDLNFQILTILTIFQSPLQNVTLQSWELLSMHEQTMMKELNTTYILPMVRVTKVTSYFDMSLTIKCFERVSFAIFIKNEREHFAQKS